MFIIKDSNCASYFYKAVRSFAIVTVALYFVYE